MGKRILVIEDDSSSRKALVRLLKAKGHRMQELASAVTIQQDFQELDAAIIDIHLPGLSGTELAAQIKLDFPAVKTVLMTSYEIEADSLTPGTIVFKKPLVIERLLRTLE